MKYAAVTISIVLAGLLGVIVASCGTGGAKSVGPVPTGGPGEGGDVVLSGSGTDTLGGETTPAETDTGGGGGSSGTVSYQVWFHRGEQLFVVHRTEKATPRVGSAAIQSLLEGPSASERSAGVG
jgi:hypothetical protein